jgi:hypothetical protein
MSRNYVQLGKDNYRTSTNPVKNSYLYRIAFEGAYCSNETVRTHYAVILINTEFST